MNESTDSLNGDNSTPTIQQLPPPAPPALHWMFIGPEGLRAGWRFVIYLASVIGLVIAFSYITRPLVPVTKHGPPPLWLLVLGETESFVAAIIPAMVMGRFEKRSFGVYGLPRAGAFGQQFWVGAIWGLAAMTGLLLLLRGVGVFYFGGPLLHGIRLLKFAGFWSVLFLMVGFFEEFLTRGYSQFTLTKGIGFWPAALLLSAAFGAIHLGNPGEAWVGALAAASIGLFFCLTLRRTGTLWFAVGMHAAWDWAESFLYSVPDSGLIVPGHFLNSSFHGSRWLTGGSVGPEGSLLVFPLIVGMWIVFDRLYPEVKYGADSTKSGSSWLPAKALITEGTELHGGNQ